MTKLPRMIKITNGLNHHTSLRGGARNRCLGRGTVALAMDESPSAGLKGTVKIERRGTVRKWRTGENLRPFERDQQPARSPISSAGSTGLAARGADRSH